MTTIKPLTQSEFLHEMRQPAGVRQRVRCDTCPWFVSRGAHATDGHCKFSAPPSAAGNAFSERQRVMVLDFCGNHPAVPLTPVALALERFATALEGAQAPALEA